MKRFNFNSHLNSETNSKLPNGLGKKEDLILFLTLLLSIALFVTYWDYVSYLKLINLDQGVLDLGSFSESGWIILFQKESLMYYFNILTLRAGRIFLSPIGATGNFMVIFTIEALAIGFPSIIIWKISNIYFGKPKLSLLLSISYLLQPAIVGSLWFPAHYQSFFAFFFSIGFYAFIMKKYKASVLLFILAGILIYPFLAFIILFSISEIIFYQRKQELRDNHAFNAVLATLIVSLLLLSISYYANNYIFDISLNGQFHLILNGFTKTEVMDKVLTFAIIFAPFLFIPFLSKRFALELLAISAFIIIAYSQNFYFPAFTHYQFLGILSIFIYLGFLDFLKESENFTKRSSTSTIKSLETKIHSIYRHHKKLVIGPAITIMFLSTIFYPFAPLNEFSGRPFELGNNNEQNYVYLNEVLSLIPKNSPYILFQDNLPEVLPRTASYDGTPLVVPYNVAYNFTHQLINGRWVPVKVTYVLFDFNGMVFSNNLSFPYNESMCSMAKYLLFEKGYGIEAQAGDIVLLKDNYSGAMIIYKPFKIYTNVHDYNIVNTTVSSNSVTMSKNSLIYGTPSFLIPGNFEININIKTLSIYRNTTFEVAVRDASNNSLIERTLFLLGKSNLQNNLTFFFNSSNIFQLSLRMWINSPNGNSIVQFNSLTIKEISPYTPKDDR